MGVQMFSERSKIVAKVVAFVATAVILFLVNYRNKIIIIYYWHFHKSIFTSSSALLAERHEEIGKVVILFWTTYFGLSPSIAWNLSSLHQAFPSCFTNCRITQDRELLRTSDAVVFHAVDTSLHDLPNLHHVNQPWIWLQQESPIFTRKDLALFGTLFNWTMTYRRDSDVVHSYLKVSPINHTYNSLSEANNRFTALNAYQIKKKKLVAWIVSHCPTASKREDYVCDLQRHVPVGIFGKCGNLTCSPKSHEHCYAEVGQKYKFYLSFENALCEDYVTEKFLYALKHNMIPIVRGGADYKSIGPPNSFINVDDFNSTKDLAEYLIFLDKNHEKYMEYFRWKLKYTVEVGDGWCALCQKVRHHKMLKRNGVKDNKVYNDLGKWWKYAPTKSGSGYPYQPACHDPDVK